MEPSFATDYYKSSIIYQIYPKSFFDSDGDGIGDLRGITSKLSYLASLGVDVISLSSLLESNSDDAIFAVTDFCRINPAIGSMEDFEELISASHDLGLKVFLSFPLVATSSAHPWFEKSKNSTTLNPYREYYTWQKGRSDKGKSAPDNKKTRFKTPLWAYDAKSNEWYKCICGEKYPELNYDNPRVRKEVLDVFRFWREKGVDGFIIENAYFSTKKLLLSDQKALYKLNEDLFDEGKHLFRMLRDIKEKFEENFPVIIDAEDVDPALYPYLIMAEKPVADSLLCEKQVSENHIAKQTSFSLKDWVKHYLSLQRSAYAPRLSLPFEDKDHTRLLSKITSASSENYLPVATFLSALLLCSVLTPALYQGEEIGMTDYPLTKAEMRSAEMDPQTLHARSTYQWDSNPNAAFTAAAFPAFPVNPNYHKINLISESADQTSVFSFYRKMIAFRKSSSALSFGDFRDYSQGNLICFTRTSETERLLLIANATHKHVNARTPKELVGEPAMCELCNYSVVSKTLNATMGLRPYEVRIFRLKAPLLALN